MAVGPLVRQLTAASGKQCEATNTQERDAQQDRDASVATGDRHGGLSGDAIGEPGIVGRDRGSQHDVWNCGCWHGGCWYDCCWYDGGASDHVEDR